MAKMLEVGTMLHNGKFPYKVESVLGIGGFGITYKVSAKVMLNGVMTKSFFAMKELYIREWCDRDSDSGNVSYPLNKEKLMQDSKSDFIAEVRRLSQVRHPNIVKIYEYFEENDTVYSVMEYLEGENLKDYVEKKGKMPASFMLNLFAPLCSAINTLHENRITHLDIKPANVMIRRQAKGISPILIDFGLSKHYDENNNATSTLRIKGCTDGYAPMEQYAGITKFSPQSDIYALAATMLFCLACERPPKASEISDEIILKMLPGETPDHIKRAICRAMHQSRTKRTQSIEQLEKDLSIRNVSKPTPSSAPSNDEKTYKEPVNSRGRGWTVFWVIFIIGAVAAGVYWLYENKQKKSINGDRGYSIEKVDSNSNVKTNVPGLYIPTPYDENENMKIQDRPMPKRAKHKN